MLNLSDGHLFDAIPPQGILETFVDGVIILTHAGDVLYSNKLAHQICQKLNPNLVNQDWIPQEIWHLCQTVWHSCSLHPEKTAITEFEGFLEKTARFRVRIRWLPLDTTGNSSLLVLLEDRQESIQHRAIADARQYQLTARQAEVWTLRLKGNSYQEIAVKLYISLETVRKHLRTIYAKRNSFMEPDFQA